MPPLMDRLKELSRRPLLGSVLLLLVPVLVLLIVVIVFLLVLFDIALCWGIRLAAATFSFVRKPLIHFVAIRKNWKRLVLATDVGAIPEWLPGAELNKGLHQKYSLSARELLRGLTVNRSKKLTVNIHLVVFFCWWLVPLLYFIPLFLRTAIKGVSILYTPLFLVINSDPINRKLDLGTRLTEMQHDNAAFLKRGYAFFAIGSFLLTILFSSVVAKAHMRIEPDATPVFILLAEYYFPPTMRVWQLVSAVNGALFLYLSWVYAPQATRRLERGIWKASEVRTYLNRWTGLQICLSIYSTMCAVAIFANFFLHHQFPARHWQWFPTVG